MSGIFNDALKRFEINHQLKNYDHYVMDWAFVNYFYIVVLRNRDSEDIHDQPDNNIYAIGTSDDILWNIKDILGDTPYCGAIYFRPINENQNQTHFKETHRGMIYEFPRRISESYLVAVDCLGYHHTIDLKERKLVESKHWRFATHQGKSGYGFNAIRKVKDYYLVSEKHLCTIDTAKALRNNIYAVDSNLHILWNIGETLQKEEPYIGFYLKRSSTDVPDLEAFSYSEYFTIDLTTKQLISRLKRR